MLLLQPVGLPRWQVVKNLPANARDSRNMDSIPGSGRCPGVGNIFLPGKFHVQRSLASYSPQDCKRVKRNGRTKQQQWQHGICVALGAFFWPSVSDGTSKGTGGWRVTSKTLLSACQENSWACWLGNSVLYLTAPGMVKFLYVVLKFLHPDRCGSPSLLHI